MIGMRIKQMVENQELIFHPEDGQMHPIQYGDIVLLERTKAINNSLMEEFNKLNIPLTVHDVESYFQATEVRVMMSLLKIIDNPQQDIPLAAVLKSPIAEISDDDLAIIRLNGGTKSSLYENICDYLKEEENKESEPDREDCKMKNWFPPLRKYVKIKPKSPIIIRLRANW